MNIKLLVWFTWNDFKSIFFYREVRARTGEKWSHLPRGQNDQITVSWRRKLYTKQSKERQRNESYCVAGGVLFLQLTLFGSTSGMSIHYFPRDEAVRQKWIRFVRNHKISTRHTLKKIALNTADQLFLQNEFHRKRWKKSGSCHCLSRVRGVIYCFCRERGVF